MSGVLQLLNEQGILAKDKWGTVLQVSAGSFSVKLEISLQNERISVLSYSFITHDGPEKMDAFLTEVALVNGATKIWVKSRRNDEVKFNETGYQSEAEIYNYYGPGQHAVICARFFADRHLSPDPEANLEVIKLVNRCQPEPCGGLPVSYDFKFASAEEMPGLAALYQQVFSTYPTPIHDADYLVKSLDHILYGVVYRNGEPVAAASADINWSLKNAEMTDFATLPEERGNGLASYILHQLEKELAGKGVYCLYSIARSVSPGMNLVFAKHGYRYTGTLIKNCNIGGGLEDMNVYCKI